MKWILLIGFLSFQNVYADTGSGYQETKDGKVLINKVINGARWAITFDPKSGKVTGNVYSSYIGKPVFLDCLAMDVSGSDYVFKCESSNECKTANCPATTDWTPISGDVTIPASFFEPRQNAEWKYPNYCSMWQYGDRVSCFGAKPEFCQSWQNGGRLACFGSHPDYCKEWTNGDRIACLGYNPSYCQDGWQYGDRLACLGSSPSYCHDSPNYGDKLACYGTNPAYCKDENSNGNRLACAPPTLNGLDGSAIIGICRRNTVPSLCGEINGPSN